MRASANGLRYWGAMEAGLIAGAVGSRAEREVFQNDLREPERAFRRVRPQSARKSRCSDAMSVEFEILAAGRLVKFLIKMNGGEGFVGKRSLPVRLR
jgi:hypothetical protein